MIGCPNCGGGLKFDIPSQQMLCEFCNSNFNPHDFDAKDKDGIEEKVFDVTSFTCPQCGGEVYSTDETAAGFCSFCGASTILFSQLNKQKKPDYIIPFQYTKEQCKEAYAELMKKAPFAPKELKDPSFIDGFRGIYMPYWSYTFKQEGNTCVSGEKSHRQGDYIITDKYQLSADLDCSYEGIAYDASSSFSDNLSETLAPFNTQNMEPFSPAYLCGFYADTADVDESLYSKDAEQLATNCTARAFESEKEFHGIAVTSSDVASNTFRAEKDKVDYAMFPVWFLSYRNNDRVAYATVNGQTGKVVADIPVDVKKYLKSSLLLAIPFFIILSLFTFTPTTLVTWVSILALIAGFIFVSDINKIDARDSYSDDRGYLYKTAPRKLNQANATNQANANQAYTEEQAKATKNNKAPLAILFVVLYIIALVLRVGSFLVSGFTPSGFFGAIISVVAIILLFSGKSALSKVANPPSLKGACFTCVALAIGMFASIINLPYDIVYYFVAALMLVAVFTILKDVITAFNILTTRQLPQFNHKGGDDRA